MVAGAPLDHLRRTFGKMPIKDLRDHMFWSMHVPRVRAENPHRNLNPDRKLFIQALNFAFNNEMVARPCGKIKAPNKPSEIGKEISIDDIDRLIRCANSQRLRFQIQIAVNTGMRKGEILSLKWAYIDTVKNIITLPKEITKTRKGRQVPISPELSEAFIKRKERTRSEYVFPQQYNLNKAQVDNRFGWAVTKRIAGVKCRFHDLRHTAATRKLRAGASVHKLSLVLGMGVDVLQGIYQHLTVEDLRETALSGGISLKQSA